MLPVPALCQMYLGQRFCSAFRGAAGREGPQPVEPSEQGTATVLRVPLRVVSQTLTRGQLHSKLLTPGSDLDQLRLHIGPG